MSIHMSVHMSVHVSVHMSLHMPIHMSAHSEPVAVAMGWFDSDPDPLPPHERAMIKCVPFFGKKKAFVRVLQALDRATSRWQYI